MQLLGGLGDALVEAVVARRGAAHGADVDAAGVVAGEHRGAAVATGGAVVDDRITAGHGPAGLLHRGAVGPGDGPADTHPQAFGAAANTLDHILDVRSGVGRWMDVHV